MSTQYLLIKIVGQNALILQRLATLTQLGVKQMAAIDDLKAAVATIAQDVTDEGGAVQAAIAKLQAAVAGSNDPAIQAATADLVAAHSGLAANLSALNTAVTAVAAAPVVPPA